MAPRKWTCAECGVTVSFSGDQPSPKQPEGWFKTGKEWHCLRCRRETVMDSAAGAGDRDAKALRRAALVEFELLRDPEAPDVIVARRARCSSAAVRPVRAALVEAGKLSPQK